MNRTVGDGAPSGRGGLLQVAVDLQWAVSRPGCDALAPEAVERRADAEEFERTYEPLEGTATWFTDYAVRACEAAIRDAEFLDGKAEKFVSFLGAITAIVLTVMARGPELPAWGWVALLAAVIPALIAVRLALQVLAPMEQFALPEIGSALQFAGFFARESGQEPRGIVGFAAKLHKARETQRVVVGAKAALLAAAHRWAWIALLMLVFVNLALAGHRMLSATPRGSGRGSGAGARGSCPVWGAESGC